MKAQHFITLNAAILVALLIAGLLEALYHRTNNNDDGFRSSRVDAKDAEAVQPLTQPELGTITILPKRDQFNG